MTVVLLVSATLIILTTLAHFELMRAIAVLKARRLFTRRVELLVLVFATFIAHLVGITVYAVIYEWLHYNPDYGTLDGLIGGNFSDFFYFSLACYTTIGFGDVHPLGDLRIMAGLEGLNGLVLIAWSAAFTFDVVRQTRRNR